MTTKKTPLEAALEQAKQRALTKCQQVTQKAEDKVMGSLDTSLRQLEDACRKGVENFAKELKAGLRKQK